MNKKICFYNLTTKETESWREGLGSFKECQTVSSIELIVEESPLLLIGRFNSILELIELGSLGFSYEKVVLVGTMDRKDDQKSALRLNILDWLPSELSSTEIEMKVEWYCIKKFGPGAMKKDFNNLRGIDSLKLTRKEESMLLYMTQNEMSSKNDLFQYIWGDQQVTRKTIDVHLFNLRKKLRKIGRDVIQLENGHLKVS